MLAAREQQNLRIHLVVIVLVTAVGIYLKLDAIEWSIIILTVGMVVVAELINTAIEYMVDLASPQYHRLAKNTKDVAAAARAYGRHLRNTNRHFHFWE